MKSKSESAHKIMEKSKLINGNYSRKILNAIITNEEVKKESLLYDINIEQINDLRKAYHQKLYELAMDRITPRYLPFYYIIKDHLPSFTWDATSGPDKHKNIHIHAPRKNNLRPSLLSLLLGRVSEETDTLLHRKYPYINLLPNSVIKTLDCFMQQSEIYYPPEEEMMDIVDWLRRGLSGNKLTVFVPICPDYAFEYTGDPKCPVKFTFDNLGQGNGIIAQWILSAIKNLAVTFQSCHIQADLIVAMADFEAFSEENLRAIKIEKKEFLRRSHLSTQAFKIACPIRTSVIPFTDLCSEQKWMHHIKSIKQRFAREDYGSSRIDRKLLLNIVEKRRPLYERWYGKRKFIQDYIDIVLDQGAMYAAMGTVLHEHYGHCLVFGADNKVMRHFYSITTRIPTLYINKKYS
jgi:hypothetical protein